MSQISITLSTTLPGDVVLGKPVVITALAEVLRGPQGVPGAAMATYTHTQAIALAVWTVPHNLGRYPAITVTDNLGNQVHPDVTYVDGNVVQITHGLPLVGRADCS